MSTILFIEDDHTLTDKIDWLIREYLTAAGCSSMRKTNKRLIRSVRTIIRS